MNPTNRFQRVMAAVLVCALCGAIAVFRERGEVSAEPGTKRVKVDGNTKKEGAAEPDPATAIPLSDAAPAKATPPTATTDAISQLAKSVVTIAEVDRGTGEGQLIPNTNTRIQAGVVIDPRGYILTFWLDDDFDDDEEKDNDAKEQQLVVRFSNQDQREYPAEVVENDRLWHLALLKIEADHPLPAISLKNVREPEFGDAVLLATSVPRKKPVKGRILSAKTRFVLNSPYGLIESNFELPDGEAGSLLVTSRGDPIGIMIKIPAIGRSSYAIPWKAVLDFIRSDEALQDVLGHVAPNPPPATSGPDQSVEGPMDSLRERKPELRAPGEPETQEIPGADPRSSLAPGDAASATVTLPPAAAPGRHIRAVTDSPAEQKLIEQLQSRESAAAELAAKIRTLQSSAPGERNQPAIDDSQRELKSHLSAAFDSKLQLEELQVKELQSKLSRLERQIGQRRALRDKIIARRAAQLVDESGLQWDTSSTSPPPPLRGAVGKRQSPPPVTSPVVVEKLRKRADLLFEGLKAGEVKPAAVLSALQDLARVDSEPDFERWQLLLNVSRKWYDTGQITQAEFLQTEAACEEARSANERAVVPQ